MKPLYLVDASSLFFRAFYAIPPLTSAKGQPTNAIYGFLTMLSRLLREKKPEHIVLCLDRKEPSFRKDLYEDYKANRSEVPDDLLPQLPYIETVGNLLGIRSYSRAGYEADDLIGSLTAWAKKTNHEVFIVSGDKDFAQLVDKNVWLYDTMKEIKYGPDQVIEKWGVRPEQFIDYLAMVGDSSDNIPGVPGIGPKGAQKLISEYGTLDQIYAHIEEIKGATKEKLAKSKDLAYLSRKLVTIVQDMDLGLQDGDCTLKPVNLAALKSFFEELNFKSFERDTKGLPNVGGGISPATEAVSEIKTEVSTSVPQSFTDAAQLDAVPVKEKTSLKELSKIFPDGSSVWIHVDGAVHLMDEKANSIYELDATVEEAAHQLQKMDLYYMGYDLKSLWHVLWPMDRGSAQGQLGFAAGGNVQKRKKLRTKADLLLMAYCLDAGSDLELPSLLQKYANLLNAQNLVEAKYLLPAMKKLQAILSQEIAKEKMSSLLEEMEYPLIEILFEMEHRGFRIDRQRLKVQSEELQKALQETEKQIHALAGESFNVGSPKQLANILFEKLKLPPGKKTKTGYSTDNEVLEDLKTAHPIAALVLEYREVAKLKSTYVDAFPEMLDSNERIHTTFRQAFTTTGRLSSVDPNLQNIPIRTVRGARVREAFIADPGKCLLSADYSQVELRILAHISQDANMIRAFREDLDIHAATAAEIFKVPLDQVTSEHRRVAKSVNFGIAYGQGAFGLAENLGISRSEAQEIIKKYFQEFPGVQEYIFNTTQQAQKDGSVSTLFGRVRKIPELRSTSPMIKKAGERAAINAPIQGTAADIVKLAMVKIDKEISIPMISQVHDELVFEAPRAELEDQASHIAKIMESVVEFRVPLKVNWEINEAWG